MWNTLTRPQGLNGLNKIEVFPAPFLRFYLSGLLLPLRAFAGDALDFDRVIDDSEREIVGQNLSENEKRKKILEHRIARGFIKYPKAATYLTEHYEQLKGRVFEGKTLREYNKMWYEYHRPRTPEIIRSPKIVGPRLAKEARFALDREGFLPRDSVIVIVPKRGAVELKRSLDEALGRESSEEELLLYILAFLNSEEFNRLLEGKASKKRGGYSIISETLLQDLAIPMPSSGGIVDRLIQLVRKATSEGCTDEESKEIDKLVGELFKTGDPKLERFIE